MINSLTEVLAGVEIYHCDADTEKFKKDYPDAVHKETKGLAVDYDKIDVDFEKVKNS